MYTLGIRNSLNTRMSYFAVYIILTGYDSASEIQNPRNIIFNWDRGADIRLDLRYSGKLDPETVTIEPRSPPC